MITKSDKLILKAFIEMPTPLDFEDGVENTLFVDSINGLVKRFLSGKKIPIDEIKIYEPDFETKERFSKILSNSSENLVYYYLVKLCFIIMIKYSEN